MQNYLILCEEGEVVNINGVGYQAGTVVELDENEESVKIAISEGNIEATDADVTAEEAAAGEGEEDAGEEAGEEDAGEEAGEEGEEGDEETQA